MNSKTLKSLLLRRAEEMAPTSEVNLWPSIQARLSSRYSVLPGSTGGFKRKTSFRALPILALVSLALILAVAFFAAAPQGQALAQQFLSLFFRTAPDQRPMPTESRPAVITPAANISEGEALTGWHIFKPAWLPKGFAFYSIDNRPQSGLVVQEYTYQPEMGMQAGYFYIGQRKTPFTDLWPVGESAQIESVKIGDVAGEYVIGAWGGEADHEKWEANPNIQHLRWKANGYYFDLQFSIAGVEQADLANSPYYISKEGLIAIASSMK